MKVCIRLKGSPKSSEVYPPNFVVSDVGQRTGIYIVMEYMGQNP